MKSEFEKRINLLNLTTVNEAKVQKIVEDAGKEFPCLACPSKETCENFKWFIKWFGKPE